jgi:hypothetical protein
MNNFEKAIFTTLFAILYLSSSLVIEARSAIAGLLVVAYLVLRQKKIKMK